VTAFLYNSSGQWIAVRTRPDDRYLYSKSGKWIGWFPWHDANAVTAQGKYLRTVVGDKLLRGQNQPHRGYTGCGLRLQAIRLQ